MIHLLLTPYSKGWQVVVTHPEDRAGVLCSGASVEEALGRFLLRYPWLLNIELIEFPNYDRRPSDGENQDQPDPEVPGNPASGVW